MCWLQKILSLPLPVKEVLCPNELLKERLRVEKGYKFVPEGGYPRISCNGVQLKLVYSYSERRYIGCGGAKMFEQNWIYYSWDKMFGFWERQGGHTQICDEVVEEILNKKEDDN